MLIPMRPLVLRRLTLTCLGLLAGFAFLVLFTRLFSVWFAATGHWQRPGLGRVEFLRAEPEPFDPASGKVFVLRHGQHAQLGMLRADYRGLQKGQTFWVLDNPFVSPMRPAQFRLGLLRLLLETAEPLFLLTLFALWRVARSRWGLPVEDPNRPRRILTDDFHARAERHRGNPGA